MSNVQVPLAAPVIQHKPATSVPDNREADDVADAMPGTARRVPAGSAPATVQRLAAASTDAPGEASPVLDMVGKGGVPTSALQPLHASGAPLAPYVRRSMEDRFGQDFSHVRVHTDAGAADSARSVGATAYAAGHHIVTSPDVPPFGTPKGAHVLAHELAHVAQQRSADRPVPTAARFSTSDEEAEADRAASVVAAGGPAGPLLAAPFSIACIDGRTSTVPKVIPTGRRAIIRWGDDPATVANVEALRSGQRSGPVAAGANVVLNHRELSPGSLSEMRELEVVIHGEPITDPSGGRLIRPGESAPRADVGVPGLPEGASGPLENVTAGEMAQRLVAAGFGKGRWTYYRVRLVMCFGGVGQAESFASRLNSALSSLGVKAETLGGVGRVTAVGSWNTQPVPRGENPPRAASRPQQGVPQTESAYAEPGQPAWPWRRPGQGWQRVPPGRPSQGGAASGEPTLVAPATPPTRTAAAPAAGAPAARPAGARGGGRVAIGAAKFLGPIILERISAYFIAKNEEKRVGRAITEKLGSPVVLNRLAELAEQQRLEFAHRQLRGESVYLTVELELHFTNDVYDEIELIRVWAGSADESNSVSTIMSHDAIVGAEHEVRYETISLLLPPVSVTEAESARLSLRAFDQDHPANAGDPGAEATRRAERDRLVAEISTAEQREEQAKLAHIRSTGVYADPKDRAHEQADIAERLQKLPPTSATAASAPAAPPAHAAAPGLGSPLSPWSTPEPALTLLPGAQGEGPNERAARAVDAFSRYTERILDRARALDARLGTSNSPTDAERQAFITEEERWRLVAKALQNQLHDHPTDRLGELLDKAGPTLEPGPHPSRRLADACAVPELGHWSCPGLLRGAFVFVDETADDGPSPDPLLGEVSDRAARPGRPELPAAMRRMGAAQHGDAGGVIHEYRLVAFVSARTGPRPS